MQELIEGLQEAAFDPSRWLGLQNQMQSYMGAMGCQIASVDHKNTNLFYSQSTIDGLDEALKESAPSSEPVQFSVKRPHWRLFTDYDYINEEQMKQSSFYSENEKYGVKYRMALRLVDDPDISVALLFFWSASQGHAQKEHFESLAKFSQHVRFAAYANWKLLGVENQYKSLLDVAEMRGSPAAIVTKDGLVVSHNTMFDSLVARQADLSLFKNELRVKSMVANNNLYKAIGKAASAVLSNETYGVTNIPIGSDGAGSNMTAWTMPLPRKFQYLGQLHPLVLLQLDLEKSIIDQMEKLTRSFNLTPAEAQLAVAMWEGHSLREYADQQNKSYHTVRNQLRMIFDKMEVNRQAALLAKINSTLSDKN